MAFGADTSRIHAIDIREKQKDGTYQSRTFNMANIAAFRDALLQRPTTKLVVIDPVSAYMGKKDSKATTDVYSVVQPLNELAAEFRVSIILITHTNKSIGTSFRNKVTNSSAWTDAVRAAFLFTKNPQNSDRRIMANGKMNAAKMAKALAFTVVEKPHAVAVNAIAIEWNEEVYISADEVLQEPQNEGQKTKDAKEFLLSRLGEGEEITCNKLQADAEKLGISKTTLWRAKEELSETRKVKAKKLGMFGGWAWSMDAIPPGPETNICGF